MERLAIPRCNPHCVDAQGNSGLHYAAGYGRIELMEYLLNTKSDPNQPNRTGQTPMALARQNKNIAAIEFLQKAGA